MTLALEKDRTALSHADICAFLYREARLLDDRAWDKWLECYSEDAEYWMPAWTDDDTLTTDPLREISLIYYANRRGLEDRVYRLKTERSSASAPEQRTAHFIANVEVLEARDSAIDLRYNWHTLSHRYQKTAQFFGTTFLTLDTSGETPKILKKKIVLKDDYIHQVIDVYHV
ncbi:benzoate 1,2-dioxygenase small subunit [Novosphingobium mangrovi (ex Huang et al. 2023)]|uniref:Benzoate 1,2-dioxygenase small subunit n=1 Tax=Novosphingobium mangrovi (ex Huang et al. 2023) TaxID=2976432 RepID=A0ABT2IA19_9SPHN|nr:benzoate 1,2-dioxygenase small subunit [Novosphingobium mangrovi (ex Huang et al. 2023)]MCT2401413.1 benzoate 1,2-dioxygenase small subunit [Novosphingobium mangrovi (ex Huang et al. 2023)]